MKKLICVTLSAALCLLMFSGCTDGAEPSTSPSVSPVQSPSLQPSPEASPEASEEVYPSSGIISGIVRSSDPDGVFTPMGDEDGVGMILYSSSQLPMTSMEDTASLELYVYAEQAGGEIAWDDGQNWYLIVRDGEDIFRLIDETYVQMGQVSFWSYWSYDEEAPHLLVMVTEGAGIQVYSYVYDKAADMFYRTEVFATDGNNGVVDSSTWIS